MKNGFYKIKTVDDMKKIGKFESFDQLGVAWYIGFGDEGYVDYMESVLPKDRIIFVEGDYWDVWHIVEEMIECRIED